MGGGVILDYGHGSWGGVCLLLFDLTTWHERHDDDDDFITLYRFYLNTNLEVCVNILYQVSHIFLQSFDSLVEPDNVIRLNDKGVFHIEECFAEFGF